MSKFNVWDFKDGRIAVKEEEKKHLEEWNEGCPVLCTTREAIEWLQKALRETDSYQCAVIWAPSMLEAVQACDLITMTAANRARPSDEELYRLATNSISYWNGVCEEYPPYGFPSAFHFGAVPEDGKLYVENGSQRIYAMRDQAASKRMMEYSVFFSTFYKVYVHRRSSAKASAYNIPYFNRAKKTPDEFVFCRDDESF